MKCETELSRVEKVKHIVSTHAHTIKKWLDSLDEDCKKLFVFARQVYVSLANHQELSNAERDAAAVLLFRLTHPWCEHSSPDMFAQVVYDQRDMALCKAFKKNFGLDGVTFSVLHSAGVFHNLY